MDCTVFVRSHSYPIQRVVLLQYTDSDLLVCGCLAISPEVSTHSRLGDREN